MKALMTYIVVAGLLFVLAMVAAYVAHYAPANSIIEAFWGFTSIFLWMGLLAVVIMAGVVHLSGK